MPVTIISAVPVFILPEEHAEHTASTPASFSDIPPVLRHKDVNARVTFDPPIPELSEDELRRGTVYVLESALTFISASSGRGFQIDYPSIILHAISRSDPPSIYCQLGESASQAAQDGAREDEEEEDATDLREMNIYPESASSLNELFEALSQCAALHPDEADSDEDMDADAFGEDDHAIVDADVEAVQAIAAEGVDGEPELTEAGRATLERLEPLIQDNREGTSKNQVNGIHLRTTTAGSDANTNAQEQDQGQFADAPEEHRS